MCLITLIILSTSISITDAQTTTSTSSQIWIYQDSGYTQAILWDIEFLNETHGWVVGQSSEGLGNGIILATTDGGVNWETQWSDESQWFNQMAIIDPNTIWVAALSTLATTVDGGKTWNYIEFANITTLFTTIGFANSSCGWTSTNHQIYFTTDAGTTWNISSTWTYDDTIRRFFFHSPSVIDAIGFDGIYHTDNGGVSWQVVFNRGGWALSFATPGNGWAVADDMLAETKTGALWEETPVPSSSPISGFRKAYLSDVQFIDAFSGWIVGSQPAVMHTADGGLSWYSQDVEIGMSRLLSIDFLNETHGWTSGYNGRILHTERGNTLSVRLWQGVYDPVFLIIIGVISVAFVSIIGFICRRRKRKPDMRDTSNDFS